MPADTHRGSAGRRFCRPRLFSSASTNGGTQHRGSTLLSAGHTTLTTGSFEGKAESTDTVMNTSTGPR
jgi:hypothetical protein